MGGGLAIVSSGVRLSCQTPSFGVAFVHQSGSHDARHRPWSRDILDGNHVQCPPATMIRALVSAPSDTFLGTVHDELCLPLGRQCIQCGTHINPARTLPGRYPGLHSSSTECFRVLQQDRASTLRVSCVHRLCTSHVCIACGWNAPRVSGERRGRVRVCVMPKSSAESSAPPGR